MKIRELCFAGAANRGIAYLGVLKYMEENDLLKLERFVGVSIGSFVGICFILGYSAEDLIKMVIDKQLLEFQDISIHSFFNNSSILEGEKYRKWIWETIEKKIDPMITMLELYRITSIDLYIGSVCINNSKGNYMEYFNHVSHSDIPLYYAIIASMSIPFVFPPVVINDKMYIDGGVINNFPMDLLKGENAWGFYISSKDIIPRVGDVSYFTKMYQIFTSGNMKRKNDSRVNVVCIDARDYMIIDFNLSIDNKITLFERGYNSIKKYVEGGEWKNRSFGREVVQRRKSI